jgi:hypothetical protein
LDYGPWQNAYSNNPISFTVSAGPSGPLYTCYNCDDTLLSNAETLSQAGPLLEARWQAAAAIRIDGGASAQWLNYQSRPATDATDHFVAGSPARQDQAWEGRVGVEADGSTYGWPLTLRLDLSHSDSRSNDSQFSYSRDVSRLSVRWDY